VLSPRIQWICCRGSAGTHVRLILEQPEQPNIGYVIVYPRTLTRKYYPLVTRRFVGGLGVGLAALVPMRGCGYVYGV